MGEEYLTKKYQKWNNFVDDSDSDNEEVPRVPTQFDMEGDEDIVVSTEMLLSPQQVERFRKLDQQKLTVWQVVVRKLRVWSASSSSTDSQAIPCRPYCILVNNLYPLGQVFNKKICDPPEQYPSAETILQLTLQAMQDPPANTPQHRPDKIVFPDKQFVGKLRKSYAALGIECSYLSESEGIDAYIRELSNHLVKNDLASVAEISERPGVSSGAGITPTLLRPFYQACARYARLEPWKRLVERQAIQIDAREEIHIDKKHQVGTGTVFSSVIGTRTNDGGYVRGLALFFTRSDLERRVLPRGQQLAYLTNPGLRRCAFCDKKAVEGSELKRCTRCQCTFYCNGDCQRSHWRDHKISCVAPNDAKEDQDKIVWGIKEVSILYGPLTSVPFDDLDAVDKYGLEIAINDQEALYPSAVVFSKGDPSIPNACDLVWLTRALTAHAELLENHPLFMQQSMVDLLDESDASEPHKIEINCTTLGFDDYLVVRNSTVLAMNDVEKLRAAIQKPTEEAPQESKETKETAMKAVQQTDHVHAHEGQHQEDATVFAKEKQVVIADTTLQKKKVTNETHRKEEEDDGKSCILM